MSTQSILTLSGGRPTVSHLDYLAPSDPVPGHTHPASGITSGVLTLEHGGSGTDLTDGSGFWYQASTGANVLAVQIDASTHIQAGILPAARGGTGVSNGTRNLTISSNGGAIAFSSASITFTIPGTGKAIIELGSFTATQIPFATNAFTVSGQAGFEYNWSTHLMAVSGITLPVNTPANYPSTPATGYFVLYGDTNGTPTVKSPTNAIYQMVKVAADLATTGSGFLKQTASGAPVSVAVLAISDIPSGLYPPLSMYWSSAGDIAFVAHQPMRLGLPYLAGSGTGGNLLFYRASGNNQNAFSQLASGHFPINLTYNDVFKVTALAMSTSGWKTATFPRLS